ncbi:MAG: AAA family ATPase [Desulfobacteraceae bacterium]|nr:AAA family ATPase [Desulfobacteraceae bacterium]
MPIISDNNKIFEPEIILKDISVKNFRGFEDIKISLDPKLNVIIGENGSGKTALLECIEKILYIFIQNMQKEKISSKNIFNRFGRDANSILYELMGVANRPEEIQKLIDKVYELIDEQELTEAKRILDNLSEDLGENDSEILRAYTHMFFMEE